MIKHLKLTKAVVAMALGIVALIVAKIMENYKMEGNQVALFVAGVLFIASALVFLYPIVFAKKADKDGKSVELQPVEKEPENQALNAS
ncbi:isoleucyl-tRNA synthetase [Pedobacter sp. SL55]|uniref:isoleucyl-tRNA synthetase n=1 Tax=Pedobacter sp. SL55 TaxID=2995161 RepID=UPI00226DE28E|nr:isoleucyl-tRNA synthetase [Pedobacter sp. SL55]WAC41357.1 isoleucyl-tRNA synthetase [Pedobacter sp. SL55]